MTAEARTYYDRWGPVARRVRRVGHYCRYLAKASLGLNFSVVVELKWRLGDEVMALPIYEALKGRYPEARVEVLCNYPELLLDNPFVDAVNPAQPSPDRYYLLRGAPRDEFRLEHYARQADVRAPRAAPKLYFKEWQSPLMDEVPGGEGPLIALAPGASWETKRWARSKWLTLCAHLESAGARVIVLGNADESIGAGTDFSGRTSVHDAAVLLHHADALVCSDSGLMHLALAAGTPAVALFGPTDPAILVRGEPKLRVVTNGRDCRGCWNGSQAMTEPGVCPLTVAECLGTVEVDAVAGEIEAALAGMG